MSVYTNVYGKGEVIKKIYELKSIHIERFYFSYFCHAQYLFILIRDQSIFRSFGVVLWEYVHIITNVYIWKMGGNKNINKNIKNPS